MEGKSAKLDWSALERDFSKEEIDEFLRSEVWRCVYALLRARLEFIKSDLALDTEASLEAVRMHQARVQEVTYFLTLPESLLEGEEDGEGQDTSRDS